MPRCYSICIETRVMSDMFPGALLNDRFVCFNLFGAGSWQQPSLVVPFDAFVVLGVRLVVSACVTL